MSSYKVHSQIDNAKINKKFKNKQSGYRPKACQYGDIWTPESYPSFVRRNKKNRIIRRYYKEWMDCELHRDLHSTIILDHYNYDNIPIWQCKLCTFLNMERLTFCSMCNHPYNFNFTHNQTNNKYISYQFRPKHNTKTKRKRKRNRKHKYKPKRNKTTDFKEYWSKMNEIKAFQPKHVYEYEYESIQQQNKVYLSKIFITINSYNKLKETEIWNTEIKVNNRIYNVIIYQTDGKNKYYDTETIINIPIVFERSIYSLLINQQSLNKVKDEIYKVMREKLKKCEFTESVIPDPSDSNVNNIENDTLDFSRYQKLHSAKELRVEARENFERKHIFRSRFVSNEHDMNIKVKYLLLNYRLQQVMVDINILNHGIGDTESYPEYIEYECNTLNMRELDMLDMEDMAIFYLSQGCFDCEKSLKGKNTVIWQSNYKKYWALNRQTVSNNTDCESIENALYIVFPKDICMNVLRYLYYDSILIVKGKVNRNWINFCVNTADNRWREQYHGYWRYDWKRYFGYKDKAGRIRYFDKSIGGLEHMEWAKVTEWGEYINEYNWLDDYSSSSAPIPDLFGCSDSDSVVSTFITRSDHWINMQFNDD